jgi:DNA-directed RNA polymerase specialized sigma24 family protein
VSELVTIPSPDDPAEALAAVVSLRRLAEQLERAAVARAVAEGWTWAQVAEALGVTRQAAHKRHAHGRR